MNIPEDFETSICKNCNHKKALHYKFSIIEEGQPIPEPGCKSDGCDCKEFVLETVWVNEPKHETEWKNEEKH